MTADQFTHTDTLMWRPYCIYGSIIHFDEIHKNWISVCLSVYSTTHSQAGSEKEKRTRMLFDVSAFQVWEKYAVLRTTYDLIPTPHNFGRKAVKKHHPGLKLGDADIQARLLSDQAYDTHVKAEYMVLVFVWLFVPVCVMIRYGYRPPMCVWFLWVIGVSMSFVVLTCSFVIRNSFVYYGPGHPAYEGQEATVWLQETLSCVVTVVYAGIVALFVSRLPKTEYDAVVGMMKAANVKVEKLQAELQDAKANHQSGMDEIAELRVQLAEQREQIAELRTMVAERRRLLPPQIIGSELERFFV